MRHSPAGGQRPICKKLHHRPGPTSFAIPGPDHGDECSVFYKSIRRGHKPELRPLGDAIEAYRDLISRSTGHHFDIAVLAMRDIGRRPQAFQRVAQLPTARADVVCLITHTHQIVERLLQDLHRQAWPVIPDTHAIWFDCHLDIRGHAGALTGIESVVDQLLEQGDGPLWLSEADLHLQLFLAEKLQQPAGLKGAPLWRLLHAHPSLPRHLTRWVMVTLPFPPGEQGPAARRHGA